MQTNRMHMITLAKIKTWELVCQCEQQESYASSRNYSCQARRLASLQQERNLAKKEETNSQKKKKKKETDVYPDK